VLSRVHYRGEHFVVDRNGESIATIGPTDELSGSEAADPTDTQPRGSAAGWPALAERLKRLSPTDPSFADDLEQILIAQPKAAFPEWPS
jgi:hypothetical protein